MRRVAIESPYGSKDAETVARNKAYAMAAMCDCLARGESPYASHLLLTQVLDDNDPQQRNLGIEAGLEWASKADVRAVYGDLGLTPGMEKGVAHAKSIGQPVELRYLRGWPK